MFKTFPTLENPVPIKGDLTISCAATFEYPTYCNSDYHLASSWPSSHHHHQGQSQEGSNSSRQRLGIAASLSKVFNHIFIGGYFFLLPSHLPSSFSPSLYQLQMVPSPSNCKTEHIFLETSTVPVTTTSTQKLQ